MSENDDKRPRMFSIQDCARGAGVLEADAKRVMRYIRDQGYILVPKDPDSQKKNNNGEQSTAPPKVKGKVFTVDELILYKLPKEVCTEVDIQRTAFAVNKPFAYVRAIAEKNQRTVVTQHQSSA